MSDVSTLVLANGETTPVDHTFSPIEVAPTLVTYQDKSASTVLGRPTVTIGQRRPSVANGNRKVSLRVRVPVLEATDVAASGYTPGPTIAYTLSANVDFVVPNRASQAEIDDLAAYAANLVSSTLVDGIVTTDDFPY